MFCQKRKRGRYFPLLCTPFTNVDLTGCYLGPYEGQIPEGLFDSLSHLLGAGMTFQNVQNSFEQHIVYF